MASLQVKNRLSSMKDELDRNKEMLIELDDKKKSMETAIIELESDVVSASSKLSMLEKQLNAVKLEQETIKQEIFDQRNSLEEKDHDIQKLEGDQDELEIKKLTLEEKSKMLTENVSQSEIILEDHERKLSVLTALVEKCEIECDYNQGRIDRTRAQLEDYQNEIRELERDESELSKHEGSLRDELREINKEYLDVDNEYDHLARHRSSLEHEVNEMSKKLKKLENEIKKQESIVSEFMDGINEI